MPHADDHRPYYVTTPIYYVNDKPHVGHVYTTLLADIAARQQRLAGRRVFFLTGTDEHADKVVTSAAAHGVTPIEWADRNAGAFVSAFAAMGVSNDDFVRTTQARHIGKVEEYLRRLQASGDVYLGDYSGWWDESQEEYLTETVAREAGFKSPVTGRALVKRTERNYFFRLSKYESALLAHIEAEPGFIRPEARRNEIVGRIRQGLQDVPVSRAIDPSNPATSWGIRVPGDATHRVYVWIDALFNYLSVVDTAERRSCWPASVHLLGKDILWFHAAVWPALLMALGEPLPGCVYAHSWWIREGRKMSKSLGNFLDFPTMEAYAERYSLDALRWFLATQGPLGATDADFAHARFVEAYNADLANGLGNAASRVSNMIAKYFDGKAPDPAGVTAHAGYDWPALASAAWESGMEKAGALDLSGALQEGLGLLRRVDGYINATEPFKVAKDESRRGELGAILYHCAEAIRAASLLLWPAMPGKIEELWRRWSCPVRVGVDRWSELARWGVLSPGAVIEKGEALFPRADAEAAPPVASGGGESR